MLVKAIKMCFVNGSRRKPGAVFEYEGPDNKYLEPADDGSEPVEIERETDDVVRAKLSAMGYKLGPRTSRARMDEMLQNPPPLGGE